MKKVYLVDASYFKSRFAVPMFKRGVSMFNKKVANRLETISSSNIPRIVKDPSKLPTEVGGTFKPSKDHFIKSVEAMHRERQGAIKDFAMEGINVNIVGKEEEQHAEILLPTSFLLSPHEWPSLLHK